MQLLQQVARLLLLFSHTCLFGKPNTRTFVAPSPLMLVHNSTVLEVRLV